MAKDLSVDTVQETILDLARRVEKLLARQAGNPRQRILVGLAGVPGSGKSTVSDALIAELVLRGVQDVAVVPMVSPWEYVYLKPSNNIMQDGFHYTKQVLSTFEDADAAFRRRGAPFTFDSEAFVQLVANLKTTAVTTSTETEMIISAPSFDHKLKDPVESAISISSRNRVIIVEGNYTLLNQRPWSEVAASCAEKYVPATLLGHVR